MLTSSELTTRRQSRTVYANNIIQKQKVAQGCATRITIGGDEGTLASDITLLHEGAVFTTVEEQTAILAANNCTPTVKQLVYAIPDFTNTVNSIIVLAEPGTWKAVASGLSNPLMNGTYTTTASTFFNGQMGSIINMPTGDSGNIKSFMRIQPTDITLAGWASRYRYTTQYNGSVSTNVNGQIIKGEYITITAPYYFILNSYSLVSGHNIYKQANNYISSWVIVGSKDGGSTYHTIDVQTNVTMIDNIDASPNHGGHITIDLPLNTRAYNNYRIIVTANKIGSDNDSVTIDSWDLFTYM